MLTLVLSIALCMAIAVPALAEVLDDDHVCVATSYTTDPVSGGGIWVSNWGCRPRYINIGKCIICKVELSWYSHAEYATAHVFTPYHATCNGVTQTLNKRCKYCMDEYKTEYVTCPGGPHGSKCDFLPV